MHTIKPKSRTKNQNNCKKLCEFLFSFSFHYISFFSVWWVCAAFLCIVLYALRVSSITIHPCCTTRWRRRRRIISRIWFGNWCCCIAACHHRHLISTFIYIFVCVDAIAFARCSSGYVLVSFHHQNWCFISIFAAIFAAASHILCDMNEIFSVWLNLSCSLFGSVWFGVHSVFVCVCVWCNSNAHGMSCVFFVSLWMQCIVFAVLAYSCTCEPCLENALSLKLRRKTYVWCQCKHRIVINYTDKIISETFCHAVFFSSLWLPPRCLSDRERDMIFFIIILCLIWLNYYDT